MFSFIRDSECNKEGSYIAAIRILYVNENTKLEMVFEDVNCIDDVQLDAKEGILGGKDNWKISWNSDFFIFIFTDYSNHFILTFPRTPTSYSSFREVLSLWEEADNEDF